MKHNEDHRIRDYDRLMLRSSFQSLFWSVILDKKRKFGFTLSDLANKIGVDKSYISRSFSAPPNWQIDKIADMASALGVELELQATDPLTGEKFSPQGKVSFANAYSDDDQSYRSINGIATIKLETFTDNAIVDSCS